MAIKFNKIKSPYAKTCFSRSQSTPDYVTLWPLTSTFTVPNFKLSMRMKLSLSIDVNVSVLPLSWLSPCCSASVHGSTLLILSSLSLSASALPEQWGFKFLSCRPHFLSLHAHSRSRRRSALPALHSPLQFNRLDFHLIPAEQHQLSSSHSTLTAKSFSPLCLVPNFTFPPFLSIFFPFLHFCKLTFLVFSFFFSPQSSSGCQLSLSTLCNMNWAGFFTSWFCSNMPLRGNWFVSQRFLPYSKTAVPSFTSAEQ